MPIRGRRRAGVRCPARAHQRQTVNQWVLWVFPTDECQSWDFWCWNWDSPRTWKVGHWGLLTLPLLDMSSVRGQLLPAAPVLTLSAVGWDTGFIGPALSWSVAETDPDSLTTGAWSKPLSRRISMVCSQVTVGSTVSGADRLSS